jgi:hypothetical protein
VTVTVSPAPDAPTATGDAYATVQDTPITVGLPGLLANDGDEDGDSLSVWTAPIAGPSNGSLILGSDGSFTYTPAGGFAGTDTFTYRVDDGTGLTDDAIVTITVSSSFSSSVLYLAGSGSSTEVWDMSPAPPPAASPVPDYDGDTWPGLTIEHSNGDEDNPDPDEVQDWTYEPATPLVLNGPVTLQLWSTIEFFDANEEGHPHIYLYDCLPGGVGCVGLAEADVHVNRWNGFIPNWTYREITIGSLSTTIVPGRELRLRLLFKHEDLWVAMTATYPSALGLTLGP